MYIIKRGVNIQGVFGPYANREEALAAFNLAYENTKNEMHNNFDGWHTYSLVESLPMDLTKPEIWDIEDIEYIPLVPIKLPETAGTLPGWIRK